MEKVSSLRTADYNPRKITDEKLAMLGRSMREFGDLSGIVLNARTGNLVGGHQRLKHLDPDWKIIKRPHKDGTGTIAVGHIKTPFGNWAFREVDWPRHKEQAANIAANKHGGEFDQELLGKILSGLNEQAFDMDLTGFDQDELNDIFGSAVSDGLTDPDAVPEVPDEPVTKKGDLYLLGNHRLLCGDSTDTKDIEKLIDREKADMIFTDPPYGVSYADKNQFLNNLDKGNRIQKPIENDHKSIEETADLWAGVFRNCSKILADYSVYYVCGPQGGELALMMMAMMNENGLPLRHTIIWAKNNHVLGRSDYNYKHEPILYGWAKRHRFYGKGEKRFSVWDYDKPLKNDLHPTMKPVELIVNAILNSSKSQMVVVDPFLGSGSTLIACEKTDRRCFGVEIDPRYCDVIIQRWEDFTGKKAERIQ